MNRRKILGRSALASLLLSVGVVVADAPMSSAATCEATTFNGFSAADDERLQRNGGGGWLPTYVNERLRVSPSHVEVPDGGVGSVFTKTAVSLPGDASFSTAFSLQFLRPTSGAGQVGADGLAFVVQPVNNTQLGAGGGGMGYQGITPSIAVEFDNYDGGGEATDSHVGINRDGSVTSLAPVALVPNLDDGDVWNVWVDYDGSTKTLEVRATTAATRPTSPTTSATNFDVAEILGTANAFFGFTSSTGAASADHEVLKWTFTNCYAPLGQSTAPTVSAGPDQSAEEETSLALDGTVTDADPEETVTTAWTVPEGTPCTFADSASVDTTVTCTEPGTYTLTLTASDGVNPAVSDEMVLTVTATPVTPVTPAPEDPPVFKPIGYRMVGFDGGVFTFGERRFHGSLGDVDLNKPIVGGADDPATFEGYWLVASDGGVFAFGSAGFFGSLGSATVESPIVEIEPTPTGKGYWLVSAAGKVHAFGDAKHFGDMVTRSLNKPVIGMAATSTGLGYWLVAEDGGIFSFGDATFFGSMGSAALNAPIDDIAPLGNDAGYYLVARDGGVFTFGAAMFHGSTGSMELNRPVIAMLVHPDGSGYWLAATDGGIFTFGSVPFFGSMGAVPLSSPVNDLIH